MKKILFLNSFYYPKYNVNGLCVNELCKVLKEDYELYSLSYKNYDEKNSYTNENCKIYKVKPRIFFILREYSERGKNKLLKWLCKYLALFIQKFKRIIYFPFYPLISIVSTKRYVKKALEIVEKEKIDCVVAVFQPYETLIAADKIKEKNKDIKEIIYILDTLSNEKNDNSFINRYKKRKGQASEKKYFKKADLIISMRCHEKKMSDSFYDAFRSKLFYSDIPLLRKLSNVNKNTEFDKKYINITYTGTIDRARRNPTNICNLIKAYNEEYPQKICAHFFSRGDCEDILDRYESIVRHGFVPNEVSVSALFNSDAIISIEAKNSDMISAKIFEYMSTNKKIIHFYESENDILLSYLKKYNNTLFIKTTEDTKENIKKINSFLNKPVNKSINLENVFLENTPGHTANMISNVIEGEKIARY